jgi:hypothetical protein
MRPKASVEQAFPLAILISPPVWLFGIAFCVLSASGNRGKLCLFGRFDHCTHPMRRFAARP